MEIDPTFKGIYMIYLASSSPRRKELLKKAGIEFKIDVINVEEIFNHNLSFEESIIDVAYQKGINVALKHPKDIVISADTIVYINGEILGKPKTKEDAKRMLKMLSNAIHDVITSVCIFKDGKVIKFSEITKVYFKNLTDEDIETYISKTNVYDKAGSYAIQSEINIVDHIEGSYTNVMGLPIERITAELKNLNV